MTAPERVGRVRRRIEMFDSTPLLRRNPVDLYESEVLDPLENQDFRARPIDPEIVRRLACLHMEDEEIAKVVDMPLDQFTAVYGPITQQGREEALVALRRVRWRVAMRGNVTMLLHLSEQYLGEKSAHKINVNLNADIPDDDPRILLLNAIRDAAERMQGREVQQPLPLPQLAAAPEEF